MTNYLVQIGKIQKYSKLRNLKKNQVTRLHYLNFIPKGN